MEKKPRLRAPNFTTSDNLLLCDIVAKYKLYIENKKIDGASLLQKQKAWLEVVKEFNSSTSGYSRTLESLQQTYKNLKKKAKKHASDSKMEIPVDTANFVINVKEECGTSSGNCDWEKVAETTGREMCQERCLASSQEEDDKVRILKKYIMRTVAGPPPSNTNDLVLEKVKGLVGPFSDEVTPIYDGDRSIMAPPNVPPAEPNNMEWGSQVIETQSDANEHRFTQDGTNTQDEISSINDRVKFKNQLLPRKRKLETEDRRRVSEKCKSLASEKMELVGLQKELIQIQIQDEKEKAAHNRSLREMEMEDEKRKYEHNEKIRKLELERYTRIRLFRVGTRRHRAPRTPNHARSA